METSVSYGIPYLDDLTGGILLGDNVVWVVEPGTYFDFFLECFLTARGKGPAKNIYVSFDFPPQKIFNRYREFFREDDFILVDAFTFGKGKGDEFFRSFYDNGTFRASSFRVLCIKDFTEPAEFIKTMSELQGEFGKGMLCRYAFDSLTGMQELWGEKDTLNFFTYTCPKLFELKALAYWPLASEAHSRAFLANISHITQLVISLSSQKESTCAAQFLKVEGRSSRLLEGSHPYAFQNRKIVFLEHLNAAEETRMVETPAWLERQKGSPRVAGFARKKYPIKIGGRIRDFRLERKLSQVELSRHLNITPSALSQIENNQSLPSLQLFVDIARFFGKSLDSFFSKPSSSP